jgi:hypothetical protein
MSSAPYRLDVLTSAIIVIASVTAIVVWRLRWQPAIVIPAILVAASAIALAIDGRRYTRSRVMFIAVAAIAMWGMLQWLE